MEHLARVRALVLPVAVAVTWVIVSCGDPSEDPAEDNTEAQPLPDASVFQEGHFDDLPRYPGSAAATEPVVKDDVVTQSFVVESATPDRVMNFFATELAAADWTAIENPSQVGKEGTQRGVWQRSHRQLVVSATRFKGYEDPSGGRTTQYSLSLGPSRPDARPR